MTSIVEFGRKLRNAAEFALSLVAPLQHLLEDTSQLLARPAFDPSTATDLFRLSAADFFTEMLLPDLMARLERDVAAAHRPALLRQCLQRVPVGFGI